MQRRFMCRAYLGRVSRAAFLTLRPEGEEKDRRRGVAEHAPAENNGLQKSVP